MIVQIYKFISGHSGNCAQLAREITTIRKKEGRKPIDVHALYNRIISTQKRGGRFSATSTEEFEKALSVMKGEDVTIVLK